MKCSYCTYIFLNGPGVRLRKSWVILDEIEDLITNHGVRLIHFTDPVFNIPEDHARLICEGIIDRKLKFKWIAWFNEKILNREFIKLAVDSGCSEFAFSPDGFDNTTLKNLNKNITRKDIEKVYRLTRKTKGIHISFNFMRSPPGETLSGFLYLLQFIIKAKLILRKKLSHIFLNHIRIEPHTEIYKMAIENQVISRDKNLLPYREKELSELFYVNRGTRYINTILTALFWLRKD